MRNNISKLFLLSKPITSCKLHCPLPFFGPDHHSLLLLLLPSRCKSSITHRHSSAGKTKKSSSGKGARDHRHSPADATDARSLLHKITEIVGVDVDSTGIPRDGRGGVLQDAGVGRRGVRRNARGSEFIANGGEPVSETWLLDGRQAARGDTEERTTTLTKETSLSLQNGQETEGLGDMGVPKAVTEEEDVSPIVHKITEIVRLDSSGFKMEDRLEGLGLLINSEIVEKVLKRCFKVGHLARRFFYWAKLQDGFSHTTETNNVMIYIAGEAKDFDLMEKLVLEMKEALCPMSIKTWTILVSQYGKAMQIGKALKAFEDMRKLSLEPDRRTFQAIVSALCKCRKVELAMEFYRDTVSRSMDVSGDLFELLMCCLSKSGDTAGVRLLGEDMRKSTEESEVYSCMLRSFCMTGRVDEAQDLVTEMKEKDLNLGCNDLRALLKCLCLVGRVAEALSVLDDMRKHNSFVDNKDYGLIIYGYLRGDDISKALQILHEMKRLAYLPTITTYSQIIDHLFKSRNYDGACKLYWEMLQNNIEPDVVTITSMVVGHIRNNNISEAWNAFNKMEKGDSKTTLELYTLFIKELCIASKPEVAFKLFIEMLKSNIKLNNRTSQLLISTLSKQGDMEEARKVEDMCKSVKFLGVQAVVNDLPANDGASCEESKVPYCVSHTTFDKKDLCEVSRILSSLNDWDMMQEYLEKSGIKFTPELVLEILHHFRIHGNTALRFFSWVGKLPGYAHKTETYNMAIKISGSAKDFKHMRNLYLEMRRRCSITSDTWNIMICQYGQSGLTEMAIKKFKEMKSDGHQPNKSTYKFLIIFLCGKKGRKVNEAIKFFKEMICAGYLPDKELVDVYLSFLCEERKFAESKSSVKLLEKNGFTAELSHGLLVKSLCRAGQLEAALTLVDEMEHLGCIIDEYTFGSLVHGLLRAGRLDEAIAMVEDMKKAGIPHTVHIYTSLIVHYFRVKQIEKAIETFKNIRYANFKPTVVTYSAMIRGYMSVDMISDAWNVFHMMQIDGTCPDFKIYSMFITCLCKAGRSDEGMLLLDKMMENGIIPSSINFRTVFYGLNKEGKQDLARCVLRTKWSLARKRKFLA